MKGVLATEVKQGAHLTDFRGREEALHGVAEQPTVCAYNEAPLFHRWQRFSVGLDTSPS